MSGNVATRNPLVTQLELADFEDLSVSVAVARFGRFTEGTTYEQGCDLGTELAVNMTDVVVWTGTQAVRGTRRNFKVAVGPTPSRFEEEAGEEIIEAAGEPGDFLFYQNVPARKNIPSGPGVHVYRYIDALELSGVVVRPGAEIVRFNRNAERQRDIAVSGLIREVKGYRVRAIPRR